MIGTETKNIGFNIRPVVWDSKSLNMSGFGIRPRRRVQPNSANLASVIVNFFHTAALVAIANHTGCGELPAGWENRLLRTRF